jgi:hypothetical protein
VNGPTTDDRVALLRRLVAQHASAEAASLVFLRMCADNPTVREQPGGELYWCLAGGLTVGLRDNRVWLQRSSDGEPELVADLAVVTDEGGWSS